MKPHLHRYTVFVFPLLLGLTSPPLGAAEDAAGRVFAIDPYVRAMAPGQSSSAAFMTLRNASNTNHAVVSAESAAAGIVELHTHRMDGGMMRMRQVERIDLPARGTTVLKPGGLHVMLMRVEGTLKAGDEVPLTLVFEDGSRKEIQVPVRKIVTRMPMH